MPCSRGHAAALAARLGDLPDRPTTAAEVIRQLVDIVEPADGGQHRSANFGFVIGGSLDSALAADMPAGWDQNASTRTRRP